MIALAEFNVSTECVRLITHLHSLFVWSSATVCGAADLCAVLARAL